MKIALDYFKEHEPEKLAQLLHCRPDLEFKYFKECRRCGGQVMSNYGELSCLQCGAPYSEEGNLIEAKVVAAKYNLAGPRLPTKRKVR